MNYRVLLLIIVAILLFGCSPKSAGSDPADFQAAMSSAKGKTVTFYGWGGDPTINRWLDEELASGLKEQYDVTLSRVPMNIDEILNKLFNEKQAGLQTGDIDVIWINGENFFSAQKSGLLYGPITGKLDNYKKYISDDDLEAKFDFSYPIDGMEAPYGKAQLVFIADTAKVSSLPAGTGELLDLAKANPGRITYPAPPDFAGSAFIRNIIYDIVGFDAVFNAESTEDGLYPVIKPAFDYLNELEPYLWQQGKTYPGDTAALDKMYMDGQILITMNYTPLYAAKKIASGEFADTSQTFVFDKGNIGNTHYVAIPFNAPNKDAALVLINHILSPEAQISKYDVKNWGDLPVFSVDRLSAQQKTLLDSIDNGLGILPPEDLLQKRKPEIQAEKVPVIEKLWMEKVLKD